MTLFKQQASLAAWLIGLVFFTGSSYAEQNCSALKLVKGNWAESIYEREPSFFEPARSLLGQKLYFYSEIANPQLLDSDIRHQWLINGDVAADVKLAVRSKQWRTWSNKNLYSWKIKSLKVNILHGNCQLGSVHFDLENYKNELTKRVEQQLQNEDIAGLKMSANSFLYLHDGTTEGQRLLKVDIPLLELARSLKRQRLSAAEQKLSNIKKQPLNDAQKARAKELEAHYKHIVAQKLNQRAAFITSVSSLIRQQKLLGQEITPSNWHAQQQNGNAIFNDYTLLAIEQAQYVFEDDSLGQSFYIDASNP